MGETQGVCSFICFSRYATVSPQQTLCRWVPKAGTYSLFRTLRSFLPHNSVRHRCAVSWASTHRCLLSTCASRVPPERAKRPSLFAWGRSCSAWATADRGMSWWPLGTTWSANTLAIPPPRPRSVRHCLGPNEQLLAGLIAFFPFKPPACYTV